MFAHKQAARTLRGQTPVSSSTICHIPQHHPDTRYDYHLVLPRLLDSDENVFTLMMTTSCPSDEKLSLFAIMINLQSKLHAYVDNTCTPYLSIVELLAGTNSVVTAIYFDPDPSDLRLLLKDETTVQTSETLPLHHLAQASIATPPNRWMKKV
ncbi:hypothetical protein BDP27DRAFT_563360 [Rhodocollybia butyracea]|uniref:Uncharacterized protein n=1 Tax=Rhodocollybia butyracea TaxID=206335 RepID=A0A9P5P7A2_9AGAR|nr:hypothetical protein BDP27DRAFT_563360 [Rhodocollybia butyracea]